MALKFLNKKGWHTGSLRNLETVWKAEQKHEAEQKKLEEFRAQIVKEREAEELRQQYEAAGLAPKQDRLEFLYDSGAGPSGNKPADDNSFQRTFTEAKTESKAAEEKFAAQVPGALFSAESNISANDKWRKIHSDPLYLIKQQELAALARIRNNPVKMEMLTKEVHQKMKRKDKHDDDERQKKKSKKKDKETRKRDRDHRHDKGWKESEEKDQKRKRRDEEDSEDSFDAEPSHSKRTETHEENEKTDRGNSGRSRDGREPNFRESGRVHEDTSLRHRPEHRGSRVYDNSRSRSFRDENDNDRYSRRDGISNGSSRQSPPRSIERERRNRDPRHESSRGHNRYSEKDESHFRYDDSAKRSSQARNYREDERNGKGSQRDGRERRTLE